jgi:hypothetical protein
MNSIRGLVPRNLRIPLDNVKSIVLSRFMLVAWRRIPRQLGFPDAGESEGAKSQRDKEDRSFSSKSLPPVHPVVRLVVIPISSLVSEGKENQ